MGEKRLALLVTTSANDEANTQSALNRAYELAQSNQIDHAFFYFDGVLNAKNDAPCYVGWQKFSEQFSIPLIACSTLADSRDIEGNSESPFQLLGLSEFYSRLHHCSKVIQL